MKKIILLLISVVISLSSLSAAEWGGIVTNETKGSTSEFKSFPIEQSNGLYLWVNQLMTPDSKWYFTSELMYKYKLGLYDKDADLKLTNIVDADLLKVVGNVSAGNGIFTLNIGRFFVTDSTSVVFNQNSDGVLLSYSMPSFGISLYGGFTGLLNSLNVSMLAPYRDTLNDAIIYPDAKDKNFYSLAHPLVPLFFTLDFPSMAKNQSMSIQLLGFLDLESEEKAAETGIKKANRFYGNFFMKGTVAGPVFYDFVTCFGSLNMKTITNYSSFNVYCYPTKTASVTVGSELSSGKFGNFTTFTGVTSNPAYKSLKTPEYGGLLLPNIFFKLSGGSWIIDMGGKLVVAIPDESISINGIEGDFSFLFDIQSDLQFSIDVSGYYDISAKGIENYYTTKANLKLSF